MSYSTSEIPKPDRSSFRCPVLGEKGKATLHVGLKNIDATVMEASVGGYTIAVKAKYAKRLARRKRNWRISYDGTEAIVRAQWIAEPADGLLRIGLSQERDLTKPERIKTSFWSGLKPTFGDSHTASVAYGGFVMLLFSAMALPGLGDSLGTSQQIQRSVRWFLKSADEQVDLWSR